MERSRGKGRGPDDWDAADWPGTDWEGEEEASQERKPPIENRPASPEAAREKGPEVEADLGKVMDDPLYDAFPTQRATRAGTDPRLARPRAPMPTSRRARLGLGQKLLLWAAFAVGTGLSFGAGLVVGASGGLELPAWPVLKMFVPAETTHDVPEAVGPELAAEGVIEFGERGLVPGKTEGAEAPLEEMPLAADKMADRPGGTVALAPSRPREAPKPAAAPAAAKTEPVPEKEEKAAVGEPPAEEPKAAMKEGEPPAEERPSEMTFYDTTTGKRDVPGLEGATASSGREEVRAPQPATAPTSGAPAGSDILARRREGQSLRPASPAPPEEAELPSGADLLARRRGAPAPSRPGPPETGSSPSGFTVQVTTLSDRAQAQALADRLTAKGYDARVVPLARAGTATLYRVRVGHYASEEAARRDLESLRPEPGTHPYIRLE
jgi:cell division septation protein DedD